MWIELSITTSTTSTISTTGRRRERGGTLLSVGDAFNHLGQSFNSESICTGSGSGSGSGKKNAINI